MNEHRVPLRAFLWEYLGYPEGETAERRRILYAIVILRLGFGLFFLLRGWGAVFGASAGALAVRLGDPARLGLEGAAADTALFILGCTELGVGALLLFGAFTRVSAVTGTLLVSLSLALGDRSALDRCAGLGAAGLPGCGRNDLWFGDVPTLIGALHAIYLGGLLVVVIAGSPFLSADRALDKLEEEERDRPPAVLPRLAERSPLLLRIGIASSGLWLVGHNLLADRDGVAFVLALVNLLGVALMVATPIAAAIASGSLLVWATGYANPELLVFLFPVALVALAFLVIDPPSIASLRSKPGSVKVRET